MPCICQLKVAAFNSRLDQLASNLKFDLQVPKLLPKLAQQANAALSAAPSAAAALNAAMPAASPAAAARAALAVAANPTVQAANRLAAAASLKAALEGQLGVNLAAPSAPCLMNGLTQSLRLSGLADALGRLGKAEFANLMKLDELNKQLASLRDATGLDPLGPLPKLPAGVGISPALALAVPAVSPALPAGPVSAQAKLDAKLAAVEAAQLAAQGAFGADLNGAAGLKATAAGLSAMAGNMGSLAGLEALLSLAMLGPAMLALQALEGVANGLGVDLTTPHATVRLGDALGGLNSNLAALSQAGLGAGLAPSARLGVSASAPAALGDQAGGNAGLASSAALAASPSAQAAAQARFAAQSRALASLSPLLAALPPVSPMIPMFLLLMAQLKALGIDLLSLTPCATGLR